MTIGIYCIRHMESGKVYVGQSINIEYRLNQHYSLLGQEIRSKDCNRHLFEAVKQHGFEAFKCFILEALTEADREVMLARELHWMNTLKSCDRDFGYNLRQDTENGMIVSDETRQIYSEMYMGENNPNYANYWNDEQKENMSSIKKEQHKNGEIYNESWRTKIGVKSSEMWKDEEKKAKMAKAVSKTKEEKHQFLQFTRDGTYIKTWGTVREIVEENPNYKWQNIYSVCNGYKPTYMGFIWKKELKG